MKKVVIPVIFLIGVTAIAALVLGIIAVVQVNKTDDESTVVTTEYSTTSLAADFAESFEFGAATSAYQIEGAWNLDGKSASIWDDAVHMYPDIIRDKTNGDEAADSYHRYKEDVQLLKDSGVISEI